MVKFTPGDRVKIVRAMSCSGEPYIGKTGVVIRQGEGFLESQYFVRVDATDVQQTFHANDLEKLI